MQAVRDELDRLCAEQLADDVDSSENEDAPSDDLDDYSTIIRYLDAQMVLKQFAPDCLLQHLPRVYLAGMSSMRIA